MNFVFYEPRYDSYDQLPAVNDPAAAARDEVLLFPELGTNTVAKLDRRKSADFAACDVVVELTARRHRW